MPETSPNTDATSLTGDAAPLPATDAAITAPPAASDDTTADPAAAGDTVADDVPAETSVDPSVAGKGRDRIQHLFEPDDGLPQHFRRVVSFHPRGGRLNPVQRKAWDTHAAEWDVSVEPGDLGSIEPFDATAVYGREAPMVIEIGSGMGESTAVMAANRPDINLLAIEVYKPGVAQTFHHLAKAGVDNVRMMRGDAVEVLTALIPENSLAEVWLFFPDPWPKARHLKRRLVNPEFVELVASRLKQGGVFRLGTDWEPYAEQMLAVCGASPSLVNAHTGWAPRPEFRPRTRFERRGVNAGRDIFDLEFVKK